MEDIAATVQKTSANDRHERYHRHAYQKIPYISHFTNDDEHDEGMTLTDTPALEPSCENPISIGK
jgi:hypothetical protein